MYTRIAPSGEVCHPGDQREVSVGNLEDVLVDALQECELLTPASARLPRAPLGHLPCSLPHITVHIRHRRTVSPRQAIPTFHELPQILDQHRECGPVYLSGPVEHPRPLNPCSPTRSISRTNVPAQNTATPHASLLGGTSELCQAPCHEAIGDQPVWYCGRDDPNGRRDKPLSGHRATMLSHRKIPFPV